MAATRYLLRFLLFDFVVNLLGCAVAGWDQADVVGLWLVLESGDSVSEAVLFAFHAAGIWYLSLSDVRIFSNSVDLLSGHVSFGPFNVLLVLLVLLLGLFILLLHLPVVVVLFSFDFFFSFLFVFVSLFVDLIRD